MKLRISTKFFPLLVITLLFTSKVCSADEFNDLVDSIFASIDDANAPGCSVGVVENGRLIHKAGYGLANLELGVELDGNNVHRMGSVSKQFTALAVLLLAEEQKIELEEDIRAYLPGLRDYGAKVTINSMLGHYSGMADYDYITGGDRGDVDEGLNIRSVAGSPFRLGNEDYLTIEEFYDVVKKAPLRRPPNQQWEYSNLAYFLLSMLVEKVSGESLREYAHARIFEPLGMTNTFFSDDPTEIVRNRASGYKPDGVSGGFVTDMTNLFWVGDGGLHTTVEDMLKWDQNFYEPRVGLNATKLLELFNTPNSDFDTGGGRYANGQVISEIDGRKSVAHGGGWLGVRTFYSRFPDDKFSTIVLCNDIGQNPSEYAQRIADIYFESR